MFKKFTKEDVHSRSNIKSSVQRGLKSKFVDEYPQMEQAIDNLIPKNLKLFSSNVKIKFNYIQLITMINQK